MMLTYPTATTATTAAYDEIDEEMLRELQNVDPSQLTSSEYHKKSNNNKKKGGGEHLTFEIQSENIPREWIEDVMNLITHKNDGGGYNRNDSENPRNLDLDLLQKTTSLSSEEATRKLAQYALEQKLYNMIDESNKNAAAGVPVEDPALLKALHNAFSGVGEITKEHISLFASQVLSGASELKVTTTSLHKDPPKRLPCVDLYPVRCRILKRFGNCYQSYFRDMDENSYNNYSNNISPPSPEVTDTFMKIHCKSSCDLCNPTIHQTKTGVRQQQIKRSDPSLDSPSDDTAGDKTTSSYLTYTTTTTTPSSSLTSQVGTPTSKSSFSVYHPLTQSRRFKNAVLEMNSYYDKGLSSSSSSSSQNNFYSVQIMFASCKNRHVHCLQWALDGVCELKPIQMAESCGPACNLCHYNYKGEIGPLESRRSSTRTNSNNNGNDTRRKRTVQDIIHKLFFSSPPSPVHMLLNTASIPPSSHHLNNYHLSDKTFGTSPFLRGDLLGIFDAIEKNRVVRGWNGIGVDNITSNGDTNNKNGSSSSSNNKHRFVPMHQFNPTLYKPRPKQQKGFYTQTHQTPSQTEQYPPPPPHTSTGNPYPGFNDSPIIALFDTFLSQEECDYLLHLIKTQGVDAQYSNDGFGKPTRDARLLPNGKLHLIRMSSRSFLQPHDHKNKQPNGTQQQQSSQHATDDDLRVNHPTLERIFDRIELVTGVPRSHIETPIQFDKFVTGQFHEGQTHFTHRTMVEKTLKAQTHDSEENIDDLKTLSSSTSLMTENTPNNNNNDNKNFVNHELNEMVKNKHVKLYNLDTSEEEVLSSSAHVLGLTIFLNDVESGGEIVFPYLNNMKIESKAGRAILYPTVLTLTDIHKKFGHGSTYAYFRDQEELILNNAPGAVVGNLKEDVRTILAHTVVKSGTKYVVSIYLRQFPFEEE